MLMIIALRKEKQIVHGTAILMVRYVSKVRVMVGAEGQDDVEMEIRRGDR